MEPAVPFAVVIPAFKAERWLSEAVRSSLAVEGVHRVIVVDDGSPEPQEPSARLGAGADARLTVIRRPNTGPAGARNTGIGAILDEDGGAAIEFVVFLDGDDELCATVQGALRDGLSAGAAAVAAAREEFRDDGWTRPKRAPDDIPRGVGIDPNTVHRPVAVWTGSGLIASGAALRAGARFAEDLIVVEDVDFYRRLGQRGPIVVSDAVAIRRRLFDAGANLTGPGNLPRWARNLIELHDRWYEPEADAAWRESFVWMLNQMAKRGVRGPEREAVRRLLRRHGWPVPLKTRWRLLVG